ncbi:MAG: hypothetical protein ACPHY8_01430 [Patescibacteria group bacterium]
MKNIWLNEEVFNFFKKQMLKKMIQGYKKLMDEKIGNGTLVVSIIAILIVVIASCMPNASYLKANALETAFIQTNDIVQIDGKTFKVVLQEMN